MSTLKKYFIDLSAGVESTILGLRLTFRHLIAARKKVQPKGVHLDNYFVQDTGIVTLEYPYEAIPVPDNGRYRLHNEIDDCIVCDKCAKVCPVDCIDIVAIKSTEEIGLTSDGSSKRLYAATFDIDMAKCCYCGLCTTVCPTECLTMTSIFDYSELDVRDMNYHFTDLTPEQAIEKQNLYEQKQAEKAAAKLQSTVDNEQVASENSGQPKPAFKPKFPVAKAAVQSSVNDEKSTEESQTTLEGNNTPKLIFKPKMPVSKIPSVESTVDNENSSEISDSVVQTSEPFTGLGEQTKPKIVFKPKMPAPKIPSPQLNNERPPEASDLAKQAIEPKAKQEEEKPKIVFKPKIPPKKTGDSEQPTEN